MQLLQKVNFSIFHLIWVVLLAAGLGGINDYQASQSQIHSILWFCAQRIIQGEKKVFCKSHIITRSQLKPIDINPNDEYV